MSTNNEKAKMKALQEALKPLTNAAKNSRSWGNWMLNLNKEEKNAKAARNKTAKNKANKKAHQEAKQAEIIAQHKAKYMTPSGLKKIAKDCKWHCQGKSCFAHKAGVCPFIHKGDPGSSKATAIPLSGKRTRKNNRR